MASRQRDDNRTRILLAQQCARIMDEEGVKDFLTAKRKAATRMRISNKALLPNNVEIEQALIERQRLFKAAERASQLRTLRETAVNAMQFFEQFRPRLVGSVLSGTATRHSDVNLHVFATPPEEVMLFLMERKIPYEACERRLRVTRNDHAYFPVLGFRADSVNVELTIFELGMEREAPRSPVDGRPMRRADRAAVMALLDQAGD